MDYYIHLMFNICPFKNEFIKYYYLIVFIRY